MVTSVIAGEKFTEHEKVMWMLSIFPEKSISYFLMALPPVLISSKEKKKNFLKSDPEFYLTWCPAPLNFFGLSVCVALI